MNKFRFHTDSQFNMTPMIDIVFLLIIFFMLVCQFITQENYQLVIPDDCPAAIVPDQLDRNAVIVSAFPNPLAPLSSESASVIYAVHSQRFDPQSPAYRDNPSRLLTDITNKIITEAALKSQPLVHLRAHRGLTYRDVQPTLIALSRAGITRVQLAAFRSESSASPEQVSQP